MKIYQNKGILSIILPVFLALLVESYNTLVEHSNLLYSASDFFSLFSFSRFLILLIIFLSISYILSNEIWRNKLFNYIYIYRLPLACILIIFAVIFQIHGSSINQLHWFDVNHSPLVGISRYFRTDEFNVHTPLALSQYKNNFSYFSDIFRGTTTDMFIIYGQPVLDIGMIFRLFQVGYLFLTPGQGLSFFWISRLIFLFLISFEFGMLLTNKNKILSISYALLITFSPVVQWWFAINGLVEQLIFGQLAILLINWYMVDNNYKKRLLIGFGMMICIGGFLLVFYPSWQLPFAYVFVLLALWIFLKNKKSFEYNKKDLYIFLSYFIILLIIMAHILTNSLDTILLTSNSAYPGSEVFNGGGIVSSFINYIPSIFWPITQSNILPNVCEKAIFVDLFPLQLILAFFVLLYQETKDRLLIGLIVLYFILIIFYLFHLPDLIVDLSLRSHIRTRRLMPVFTFVGVIILIRAISNLKDFENKTLVILFSLILSTIMVYLSFSDFYSYYLQWMPLFAIIFYFILFASCFLASSKRNQKIFLICIIMLSFLTGGLANPIDSGTDVIYESNHFKEVESIVQNDPNGLWIVQEMPGNLLIPAGAKTINSIQTYPEFETWQKIDANNQYNNIYNRYAHIKIAFQDENDTSFELLAPDSFRVNLNVNDLEKLNVSYIATNIDLEKFSNDNVEFKNIYNEQGFKIYSVKDK